MKNSTRINRALVAKKCFNFSFKSRWLLLPLMLLTFSVGQIWGAEETVYNADPKDATGGSASYTSDVTLTLDSKSWNASYCYKASTEFRLGHNQTSGVVPSKYINSSTQGAALEMQWDITYVSSFSVTLGSSYGTVSSVAIYESTDGGATYTNVQSTTSVNTTFAYTPTTPSSNSTRYAIVVSGTSKPRVVISNITIKRNEPTASCSKTPTMSFTPNSVEKTEGDEKFTKTVSITGKGTGQTVAYSSSNTSVATVNSTTGEVTIKTNGSTTITASVSESGDYCSASATYTLTVNKPSYTVNWYVGGTQVKTESVTKDEKATLPSTPADNALGGSCTSLKFMGWSETNIGSTGTTAPADLFTAAPTITSAKNYYAVFAEQTGDPTTSYDLVSSTNDLVAGQQYVIGHKTSEGDYYYMPNAATSSNPTLSSMTITGTQITSTVTNAMLWTLRESSVTGYGYKWESVASSSNYLATIASTGDKIRVGASSSYDKNSWDITTDNTYTWKFKSNGTYTSGNSTKTGKYAVIYGATAWRVYAANGTNALSGAKFVIFKKNTSVSYGNYRTSCCSSLDQINGSFF